MKIINRSSLEARACREMMKQGGIPASYGVRQENKPYASHIATDEEIREQLPEMLAFYDQCAGRAGAILNYLLHDPQYEMSDKTRACLEVVMDEITEACMIGASLEMREYYLKEEANEVA